MCNMKKGIQRFNDKKMCFKATVWQIFCGSLMIVMGLLAGCSEWDVPSGCDCVEQRWALSGLEEDVDMIYQDSTSDVQCGVLVEALLGAWDGLGDRQDSRMVFGADGQYEMWKKRRGAWTHLYTHRYWIGYAMHQGMMRTELHMDLPDMEDYVVRYYLSDNILHLEEPTWNEPVMRFARGE